MKTAPIKKEFLDQMCDQTKFKPFKVKFVQSPDSGLKLSEKTPYLVTDVFYSTFFKWYAFTIGENQYTSKHFRLVVDQPDHSVTDQFQPEPIHPDNATIETLIQYVSEHRDSMSKDSILHFANLIGLIKLGAL